MAQHLSNRGAARQGNGSKGTPSRPAAAQQHLSIAAPIAASCTNMHHCTVLNNPPKCRNDAQAHRIIVLFNKAAALAHGACLRLIRLRARPDGRHGDRQAATTALKRDVSWGFARHSGAVGRLLDGCLGANTEPSSCPVGPCAACYAGRREVCETLLPGCLPTCTLSPRYSRSFDILYSGSEHFPEPVDVVKRPSAPAPPLASCAGSTLQHATLPHPPLPRSSSLDSAAASAAALCSPTLSASRSDLRVSPRQHDLTASSDWRCFVDGFCCGGQCGAGGARGRRGALLASPDTQAAAAAAPRPCN